MYIALPRARAKAQGNTTVAPKITTEPHQGGARVKLQSKCGRGQRVQEVLPGPLLVPIAMAPTDLTIVLVAVEMRKA